MLTKEQHETRLIFALRRELKLASNDDVSNDDILETTAGTFLRVKVEARLAAEDLSRTIRVAFLNDMVNIGSFLQDIWGKIRRR